MIAIARHEIPHVFGEEVLAEAERAAKLPLTADGREDLRDLPIVAIDPVDARDHDDAVWAIPDADAPNNGGCRAAVAIAAVSFYVRPAGAPDLQARRPRHTPSFPTQAPPLLPE